MFKLKKFSFFTFYWIDTLANAELDLWSFIWVIWMRKVKNFKIKCVTTLSAVPEAKTLAADSFNTTA